MKVYKDSPTQNVIILVVTGILGGGVDRNYNYYWDATLNSGNQQLEIPEWFLKGYGYTPY